MRGTRSLPRRVFSLVERLRRLKVVFITTDKERCPGVAGLFTPITSRVSCVSRGNTLTISRKRMLCRSSFSEGLTKRVVSTVLRGGSTRFAYSTGSCRCLVPGAGEFRSRVLCRMGGRYEFMGDVRRVATPVVGLTIFRPTNLARRSIGC